MMNVYNGNVTLDSKGEATVELPDYFGALNRDYRYQLTPIGASRAGPHCQRRSRTTGSPSPSDRPASRFLASHRHSPGRLRQRPPDRRRDAQVQGRRGTREFVPAGSSAKRMMVGPAQPAASPTAPVAPLDRDPGHPSVVRVADSAR